MCSDGLWDPLGDEMIAEYLKEDDLGTALKEMSYQAETQSYPRSDNISVAAFQYIGESSKEVSGITKPEVKQEEKQEEKSPSETELEDAIAHMKDSINAFRKQQF